MLNIDKLKQYYYTPFLSFINSLERRDDNEIIIWYWNGENIWYHKNENHLTLSCKAWRKITKLYAPLSKRCSVYDIHSYTPWTNQENKKMVKYFFEKCISIKVNTIG